MQILTTIFAKNLYKSLFITSMGAAIIALLAQISIEIEPVPITLQTVAVMLIGYRFSPSQALKSTTLYLLLGLAGIPVFSNFAFGPQVIFGPTGGYILGFIPSAYFLALATRRFGDESWLVMTALGLIATAITFVFGISWLSFLIGVQNAFTVGFLPFILPGITKVVMLTSLLKMVKVKD
jgi:biotin transport system substrate-specific component